LSDIWRPRLEVLAEKFSGRVKVSPHITKGLRQATFDFQSTLASVQLQFTVSTDTDVRKIAIDYNLEILPILMKFEPHAQIEFPLDAVDAEAIGKWIDDHIVDFVRTYLSMSQNKYYLKDHMVVDPIAGIEFPKFAAATTLEQRGKTVYFISEKTRSEFEKQAGTGASGTKGTDK
jgi:YHS domain-containing protein